MKVFLQEKLGLETHKITTEKANRIRNKENIKRKTTMGNLLYYLCEQVLIKYIKIKLWEDQIYINEGFNEYTMEKRRILFELIKEFRDTGVFAEVVYKRFVSY